MRVRACVRRRVRAHVHYLCGYMVTWLQIDIKALVIRGCFVTMSSECNHVQMVTKAVGVVASGGMVLKRVIFKLLVANSTNRPFASILTGADLLACRLWEYSRSFFSKSGV